MLISIIKPFTCTIGIDCSTFGNMLFFHSFGCPSRVMAVAGQCQEVAHHTGCLFLQMWCLEQADIYSLFVGVHVSRFSVVLLLHDLSQSKYDLYDFTSPQRDLTKSCSLIQTPSTSMSFRACTGLQSLRESHPIRAQYFVIFPSTCFSFVFPIT